MYWIRTSDDLLCLRVVNSYLSPPGKILQLSRCSLQGGITFRSVGPEHRKTFGMNPLEFASQSICLSSASVSDWLE